ncbi:MAG: GNAT family N-acetyltransferase, partial [Synergistaceae bacterium]|nr:GNAT family N-acetyltransferase [Synergistaceae bacterium]
MDERDKKFAIRDAVPSDCGVILEFIRKLASYDGEGMSVTATEADIRESLFEERQACAIIGEEDGEPVAFAGFLYNYSTFLGRANVYLEDLFVEERCRGRGHGRAMLGFLARTALERGCKRLDWLCLDDNARAKAFYGKLGARAI